MVGLLLALALGAVAGPATARADSAPQRWLATTADLVRTLRPCPMAVSAPTAPVCWSMTEDTTAWMAQPAGSPYPWGQCTYYAGLMRPDIWNDRAPPSADPLAADWDAWTWVEHAQAEGLSVDDDPQPGDVMVYSRAAVGNDTGHVAIVDAVGGTDPSTGDLELTVSEMNVEGLDDASLGQGDTMTILVPRSQLVPGMIEFIHRPGPGYTAPVWPNGSDAGLVATVASAPAAAQDPSLSVGLVGDDLETVSESTAPLSVTVTALPGGAVVERQTATANQIVSLNLASGTYQVCVAQAPAGIWPAVSDCATGDWETAVTPARMVFGRARLRGGDLSLSAAVRAAVRAGAGVPSVRVALRMTVRRAVRIGRRRVTRTVTVYRGTLDVHGGAVELRLPASVRRALRRRAVLHIRVSAQTTAGLRISAMQLTETV